MVSRIVGESGHNRNILETHITVITITTIQKKNSKLAAQKNEISTLAILVPRNVSVH